MEERVLYVGRDDEEATRCVRALRRAGFPTTRTGPVKEGLGVCRRDEVSVVVLDAGPTVRGVLRTLEQFCGCGASVIVIAPAKAGRRTLRYGAWDYIDRSDPSHVRDLTYGVSRALTFTRLQHECSRGAPVATESASRHSLGPVRSLADAVTEAIGPDITSPLSALRSYSRLLQQSDAFDEGVAALARRLDAATGVVGMLVDGLTEALHNYSASQPLIREATDFNRLIDAAIRRVNAGARRRNCHIEFTPARLLPTVVVDRRRVGQLVEGILSRAVANTSPRAFIRVATGVNGRQVVLRIEATAGVAPSAAPGSGTGDPTEDAAGTVALARVIIAAHGGDVTVQTSPGVGLGLTVRLPVARAPLAVGS
jgi:two-component system, OmpR family, sensor kinase